MDPALILLILTTVGIFVFAVLSANGGHGGAYGYLAIMVLLGMRPIILRPTALALTILVALVTTIRSYRSGYFRWRLFWPFALGSIPAAFLAANVKVRPVVYAVFFGMVLLYSAIRLFFGIGMLNERKTQHIPIWMAVLAGAAIGSIVGIAGVGGGIFLTPLLLLMRWAKTNEAIGVTAPFVLINSLVVFSFSWPTLPLMVPNMLYWAPAALVGGWIGNELDMRPFPVAHISKALSIVVFAAVLKLMSTII